MTKVSGALTFLVLLHAISVSSYHNWQGRSKPGFPPPVHDSDVVLDPAAMGPTLKSYIQRLWKTSDAITAAPRGSAIAYNQKWAITAAFLSTITTTDSDASPGTMNFEVRLYNTFASGARYRSSRRIYKSPALILIEVCPAFTTGQHIGGQVGLVAPPVSTGSLVGFAYIGPSSLSYFDRLLAARTTCTVYTASEFIVASPSPHFCLTPHGSSVYETFNEIGIVYDDTTQTLMGLVTVAGKKVSTDDPNTRPEVVTSLLKGNDIHLDTLLYKMDT